ncbi:MAG: DUF6384 family protein [Gammaproteobacteria bacterium]|nr:DUF6384 family protein [Gammaproteobacteria bacterium]
MIKEVNKASPNNAPLEDVMVAMDVVDTLRHQQEVVERELDTEGRQQRLLERLTRMYRAQGIEVPEYVLQEGIKALEEERFSYKPVAPSWGTKLAHIWVSRNRWGKPIGVLSLIGAALWGVYFAIEILPERELRSQIPTQISKSVANIKRIAKSPDIVSQAEQLASNARSALSRDNLDAASSELDNLNSMAVQIAQSYTIRVVSRPRESSGVWRIPPGNAKGRNYYLIVEAIDQNNKVVELPILNEENNKTSRTKTWGLRVNEQTFYKIASDKQDDGIIQANKVGYKNSGYLKPEYIVPTTGATISEW